MKLLISACLLGTPCRYDGQSKALPGWKALAERHELVPLCPEILGGLATPRPPAEKQGGRVVTQSGTDVTEAYRRGAEETLRLARELHCQAALLKGKSPSCGRGQIYDGSFTRTLTQGDGVTAALLEEHGIPVFGDSEWEKLL